MRRGCLAMAAALAAAAPLAGAPPPAASAELRPPAALESLAVPAAPGSTSPYLALAGERLLATWIEPDPGGGHRVRLASRAAGGAWSAPATVAAGRDLLVNWADTPGVVAAGDGALVAWWLVRSAAAPHAYDAHLARSTDGGRSFVALGRLHDATLAAEYGFVAGVAEGTGARLFYLDGRATPAGGAMQLRTARVDGQRIGAGEVVDEAVCDCCPLAAAALPGGGSLVAFRDREAGEIRDVRVLRWPLAGPPDSVAPGAERWEMPGCPVNGPALAAAGERAAVAWFSAAGERPRVAVALSADGGRHFGPPRELDADQPLGRVAVTALEEGFAVAWLGRAGDRAELRVVRLDGAGRAAAPVALARPPAGRPTGVPRLVRLGDRLIAAWTEPEPAPGRIEIAALPVAALARP